MKACCRLYALLSKEDSSRHSSNAHHYPAHIQSRICDPEGIQRTSVNIHCVHFQYRTIFCLSTPSGPLEHSIQSRTARERDQTKLRARRLRDIELAHNRRHVLPTHTISPPSLIPLSSSDETSTTHLQEIRARAPVDRPRAPAVELEQAHLTRLGGVNGDALLPPGRARRGDEAREVQVRVEVRRHGALAARRGVRVDVGEERRRLEQLRALERRLVCVRAGASRGRDSSVLGEDVRLIGMWSAHLCRGR